MSTRKLFSKTIALVLVFTVLAGMIQLSAAAANTDVTIVAATASNQTSIQNALNAASAGDTVTVSGMASNVTAPLTLNIPANVTVVWEAFYLGSIKDGGPLITLNGNGKFEVISGWTENAGSGITLNVLGAATEIVVSGGTLAGNSGNAIYTTGAAAKVTVCGDGSVINYSANNIRPAIYMFNQANTILNVIVKDNGSVASLLEGGTGYAIQTYGDVDISGDARVYATGGRAINALGVNSRVNISENSKVWSETGIVVRTSGAGARITVSGGEVYNSAASSSYPVLYLPDGNSVTVSGAGKVQALGAGGRAIETNGNVTVADDALVSATTGNAIYANGAKSITISGGQVAATTGNAINATAGATIDVSGGKVSSQRGNAINASANATISVSGGSVAVADPTATGAAINTSGAVKVAVSGGQVSATQGYAINASNSSSTVDISGGFVFSYGTPVTDVVRTSPAYTGPSGNGVVVAWNAENDRYKEGETKDLFPYPARPVTDVYWTIGGISYTNGANTGFFPIGEVTVVSYQGGLYFNIADGKFYRNLDGTGLLDTSPSLLYTAQNSNYTFDDSDPSNKILTLKGFKWNSDETDNTGDPDYRPVALWITGGTSLTIELESGSVNSFISMCENTNTTGVFSQAALTITGAGTLEAIGSDTDCASFGIICADLDIEDGTIIATGGKVAAATPTSLTGNPGITGSAGIGAANLTINGGTVVATGGAVTSDSNEPFMLLSAGIICSSLTLPPGGGSIVAAGGGASAKYAGVTPTSTGLFCIDFSIEGGEVSAAGGAAADTSAGIIAGNSIIVAGGMLSAFGGEANNFSAGVIASGAGFSISGGEAVCAAGESPGGESIGISADLSITGGTITAVGFDSALDYYYAAFALNEPANIYWKNDSSTGDPGGTGTLVYTGGAGAPFAYSPNDFFVKITTHPIAFVENVTVKGSVGAVLDVITATVSIHDDVVGAASLDGVDAASWFTSELPPGVDVRADADPGSSRITLTFTGVPRAVSDAVFGIVIPNDALAGPADVPVQLNVNARFEIFYISRTVTFEPNGGVVYPDSTTTKTIDGTLTLIPTPIKIGFNFGGWFLDTSLNSPVDEDTVFVYDSTIYALWLEIPYNPPPPPPPPPDPGPSPGPGSDTDKDKETNTETGTDTDPETKTETDVDPDVDPEQETEEPEDVDDNGDDVEEEGGETGDPDPGATEPGEDEPQKEPGEEVFNDVKKDDWFYEYVNKVFTNDLMYGTSDDPRQFEPYLSTTRGMVVTILYRMEDMPDVAGFDNRFDDVDEGKYYYDAVKWAQRFGIILGYSYDKYGPEDNVTREQLVAILHRYSKWKGIDVSVGDSTSILDYPDALSTREYAVPCMQWACGAGIILGKPDGTLDPGGEATRAELAAILTRFMAL